MNPSSGIRWTARPGDSTTVAEVLSRTGADARALLDGRVFVGRLRVASPGHPVRPGDVVVVAPARQALLSVPLLARDGDLLAVDKPAGVPTIADHGGGSHALVAVVAAMLGVDPKRVHPASRLDRDVSGVVGFSLTQAAAERVVSARSRGDYVRRYVAIAGRSPVPSRGAWKAPIGRTSDPRLRRAYGENPTWATTLYAVCARAPAGEALLALAPVTGRTHQLRVHAAHSGAALVGDRAYGGPVRVTLPTGQVLSVARIALHAAKVTLRPLHSSETCFEASSPIPAALRRFWTELGGEDSAWEVALTCAVGPEEP